MTVIYVHTCQSLFLMVRQRGIAQVRRELIQSILNSDFGRLSNGLNYNVMLLTVPSLRLHRASR